LWEGAFQIGEGSGKKAALKVNYSSTSGFDFSVEGPFRDIKQEYPTFENREGWGTRRVSEVENSEREKATLEVCGGLGYVLGLAHVAPVILVGAEGEDSVSLGSQAQVGCDD
jgi:hypothetical protein